MDLEWISSVTIDLDSTKNIYRCRRSRKPRFRNDNNQSRPARILYIVFRWYSMSTIGTKRYFPSHKIKHCNAWWQKFISHIVLFHFFVSECIRLIHGDWIDRRALIAIKPFLLRSSTICGSLCDNMLNSLALANDIHIQSTLTQSKRFLLCFYIDFSVSSFSSSHRATACIRCHSKACNWQSI